MSETNDTKAETGPTLMDVLRDLQDPLHKIFAFAGAAFYKFILNNQRREFLDLMKQRCAGGEQ